MKNFGFLLLGMVVFLAFTACNSDTNTSATANGTTDTDVTPASVNTERPNETPAAPQVNLPEYQRKAEELPKTTVEFENEKYDFGKVASGEKVLYKFKFKNTGSNELVLTDVKASCGCTTPGYSKEPVAPGEEGFIDVQFDSKGRSGVQQKSITVTGNFEDPSRRMVLYLTGEVVKS